MTLAHKLTLALAIALAAMLAFASYGFVKEHEANAVLALQQKDAEAQQNAIAAKERENQQALAAALKSFAAMKQQVQTPEQVAKALPALLPDLSLPLEQITPEQAKALDALDVPELAVHAGDIVLPAIDAKQVYDAAVDCKANAARLSACEMTVANDQALIDAKDGLIRDQATALKGGTKWQRVKSAAKWTLVGIAGGIALDELARR
jgi:Tfp pilus assembly protein PilN